MLFDGSIGFAVPFLVIEAGVSKTMMGLIFGFSSIVGAGFDFILSAYIKSIHFRRMYLLMFVGCLVYAAVIAQAHTVALFLIAMGLWGIYYDLMNFGTNDFVSRCIAPKDHTVGYSLIDWAKSLGLVIAPIIGSIFVTTEVSPALFGIGYLFLLFGIVAFIAVVIIQSEKTHYIEDSVRKRKPAMKELILWLRTSHKLWVPLTFIFILYVSESFFWVIGPLISEDLSVMNPLGGLILTAYFFPSLILDWFVPSIVAQFGKKETAFVAFLVSAVLLTSLVMITSVVMIIICIFLLSCCLSLAYPAIRSAISDYITENPQYEHEIQGVTDFSSNIAYVIGPILAGVFADTWGNQGAFSAFGVMGIIVICFLLPYAKKDIRLRE